MKEIVEKLASVNLHNERSIWIRTPDNPSTTSNVTVFLDGEFYRDNVDVMAIIDDLQGKIADSWYLFVSMASIEARWVECPCHVPFARFIVDELLPWFEQNYSGKNTVSRKIIAGLSYTGLAAAFVAKEYPCVFQKVICQSGSFWWEDGWLIKQFEQLPYGLDTEFYLDVGVKEIQENVRHRDDVLQSISQIEAVRKFRDVLLRQGGSVQYVEFDGGHDFNEWKKTLPGALAWALPNE